MPELSASTASSAHHQQQQQRDYGGSRQMRSRSSNGNVRLDRLYFIRRGVRDISTLMAAGDPNFEGCNLLALHNVGDTGLTQEEIVDEILLAVYSDVKFRQKYVLQSLFLIGAGAFGSVFRLVTQATGSSQNPKYSDEYVKYLQKMRKTTKRSKTALLDAYRDERCLDLVAIKFEPLTPFDIENNSIGKINLVREFFLLQELFSNPDSRYSMVGFPLPIDFDYIGGRRITKDLNKVIVYDPYGVQSSFRETYLEKHNIYGIREEDITDKTYFTMELLGPNLDDWKEFFAENHSHDNRMFYSVQTTLKLMDQFLCRLLIMHRKNMIHLDLKPDNLCLGIGKMTNTVYLLDYGLSRICSENKPDITMGSRRYMSVGVLNLEPANYMMDIESWFYILIVLLTDFIPWSDEELSCQLGKNEKEGGAREEKLLVLVTHTKKQFWGDENNWDKNIIQKVVDKIESYHKAEAPDIGRIVMDIYEHVKKMRQDFYKVSYTRMNADIKDEESDLFKRYKTLRKLLLFPYDCDFTVKGSCFANDKDIQRKQEERKAAKHTMLIYAEDGRNWHWDWDLWYAEDFGADDSHCHQRVPRPPGVQFQCSDTVCGSENNSSAVRKRSASLTQQQQQKQPRCVSDDYDIEDVIDYGLVKVKQSS